ncbi:MAG: hypothetical protein U1F25_06450 [Rubrivivax sp.]
MASRAWRSTPRTCATAASMARRWARVVRAKGGTAVDAGAGLAFPACALAVEEAAARAR